MKFIIRILKCSNLNTLKFGWIIFFYKVCLILVPRVADNHYGSIAR